MNKRAKDTFTRSDIEASLKKEFPNLSKSDIANAIDSISNVIINSIALDEKVDSIILSIDAKNRSINLSIKELEIRDEKEALNKYGSSASGASLGDILGSVLKK